MHFVHSLSHNVTSVCRGLREMNLDRLILVSRVVCPVLCWSEEGRTVNVLDMHKDLRFVLVMHHVFIASFVLCSKCRIRKSKQCLPDCLFYVFLIVLVCFSLTSTENTSVTRDVRVSADHATFPTSKRFWSGRWLQLAQLRPLSVQEPFLTGISPSVRIIDDWCMLDPSPL